MAGKIYRRRLGSAVVSCRECEVNRAVVSIPFVESGGHSDGLFIASGEDSDPVNIC